MSSLREAKSEGGNWEFSGGWERAGLVLGERKDVTFTPASGPAGVGALDRQRVRRVSGGEWGAAFHQSGRGA